MFWKNNNKSNKLYKKKCEMYPITLTKRFSIIMILTFFLSVESEDFSRQLGIHIVATKGVVAVAAAVDFIQNGLFMLEQREIERMREVEKVENLGEISTSPLSPTHPHTRNVGSRQPMGLELWRSRLAHALSSGALSFAFACVCVCWRIRRVVRCWGTKESERAFTF